MRWRLHSLGGDRRQEDSGLQLSRGEGIDRTSHQWRTKRCRGRRETEPSQTSVRCRIEHRPETEGFAKDVIIKALSARRFKANAMPAARRLPPPWIVDEHPES